LAGSRLPLVPDVDRVLESDALQVGLPPPIRSLDGEDRVARLAVLGNNATVLAHMLVVVAPKAAKRMHVIDVVRKLLPTHIHLGEVVGAVDRLNLLDRVLKLSRHASSFCGM